MSDCSKLALATVCLLVVAGCQESDTTSSAREALAPTEATEGAPGPPVRKVQMPLSIEVQGLDRTYQFGGRVPLKFTIRNEASHSIWLNVSMLPWNYRYSLSVSEDSPYLASGPTIHDIWDIRWRELKPEEAISGEYDLSQRLAIRERPPSREAVIARIAVSVFVTESDPEVSERRVLDIDLGQLTIEVSPTRSPR